MSDYPEIDKVVLTLIQATGLLLPVIFLTVRFYVNNTTEEALTEEIDRAKWIFKLMVACLTVTGFFATFGIFDSPLKIAAAVIAVSSLAIFFLLYGWFMYHISSN